MSPNEQVIDQRHFDYIAERTSGDDAFLTDLKMAAEQSGIPSIWISPAQASLMQILLKLGKCRHVVEVGTLAGYSAISMARSLPADGRVTTLELDESHADFAESWIIESDVANKICLMVGPGIDALRLLPDHSADACFIDADKEGYFEYLMEMKRILVPGSLMMIDNAFAFGELFEPTPLDPATPFLRDFNEMMSQQDWIHSTIVAAGDGLWIGIKKN